MRRTATLVFFAVAAVIFFSNLGGWDLWNPDEPRYAQVAREMIETGSYALPHINGVIYPDKPPLFFWMIAGASFPFGDVNAFSARFPSAFFGFCLILLTYFFTRKIFDPLTALLAAVILFTIEGFFKIALSVHFDSILAFFTTASLFCFYCGYEEKKNRGYFLLSWLFMGLAVSTKGPVGLAVPLVSIVTFLLCCKDFDTLKRFSVLTGFFIVIVIVSCWLLPACISGGEDYTNNILLKQTFGRLVKSYSHEKPFYYYLYKFPFHILPWSLFIPGACYYFWKQRREIPEIRFPLVWFLAPFIFLSIVSGKRGLYLLPLYPAAAMLMAKFWRDHICMEEKESHLIRQELFMLPAIFVFGVFVLAGIGLNVLPVFKTVFTDMPQSEQILLLSAGGLISFFGLLGIVMLFSRFRIRSAFTVLSAAMIVLAVCTVFVVYPQLNRSKSARFFAQRINTIVGPEDKLVASFDPELFNYYLHRYPIPHIKDDDVFLDMIEPSERVYLLTKEKAYLRASENLKKSMVILDRDIIKNRTYYLLVNREVADGV